MDRRVINYKRRRDKRRRFYSRLKLFFPILLIGAGIGLILYVGGLKLYTRYQQDRLLQQYFKNQSASVDTTALESTDTPVEDALNVPIGADDQPPVNQKSEEMSDGEQQIAEIIPDTNQLPEINKEESTLSSELELIGVLQIPKINLKVAIAEGVTRDALRYSVGHFEKTALPGDYGNCSIIGHRNYVWGEYFNRLDEIEVGDKIKIVRADTTYTYYVTEKFVVEPEEIWVLDQGDESTLTLITCTPIRIATHRLIIKAILDQ
ncbi:MAG: class D sortase [Mobilitalea sp.]